MNKKFNIIGSILIGLVVVGFLIALFPKADAKDKDPEVEMLRNVIKESQLFTAECPNKIEAAEAARKLLCTTHKDDCTKENVDPLGLGHVDPSSYLN